eukprot:62135-Amphidinium_carterae.1
MVAEHHDSGASNLATQEVAVIELAGLIRYVFVNGPSGSRSSSSQEEPLHRSVTAAAFLAGLSSSKAVIPQGSNPGQGLNYSQHNVQHGEQEDHQTCYCLRIFEEVNAMSSTISEVCARTFPSNDVHSHGGAPMQFARSQTIYG